MKVGIIGAGRIGKVHAQNISRCVPEMEIICLVMYAKDHAAGKAAAAVQS